MNQARLRGMLSLIALSFGMGAGAPILASDDDGFRISEAEWKNGD